MTHFSAQLTTLRRGLLFRKLLGTRTLATQTQRNVGEGTTILSALVVLGASSTT